jgi:twitching motility protein PilT
VPDIFPLLDLVVRENASDLHLTVGRPPVIRLHGRLHSLEQAPLRPEDTQALMRQIIPERNLKEIEAGGTTDFAYPFERKGRFRVSAYRQRGHTGLAMRLIPEKLLSFEEIGLPVVVKDLVLRPRGLFLVTGPTGSGKTTTMATMIDYINSNYDRHIVTVEDPIEYYHHHKKSILTQREVGIDVPSFGEALRRVLRQDPNVILVGEMRDLETITAAIVAAETGHLVLATLHTTGSARTVDRIIDVFPPEQQEQIRVQLSVSLIAVLSQVLVPRSDQPGRLAAYELMIMTPAIENHIRKNETFKIVSAIQTSRKTGMILLDENLLELHRSGRISYEEMMAKAQMPKDLEMRAGGMGGGS